MSNSTKKWSSVSTSTQDLITEESPQNETPTCSSSGSKNATMLSRLKNFAEKDAFDSDFKINDDQEIVEPEFGVLARLRKGIKIIHDHSRETMAECYSGNLFLITKKNATKLAKLLQNFGSLSITHNYVCHAILQCI